MDDFEVSYDYIAARGDSIAGIIRAMTATPDVDEDLWLVGLQAIQAIIATMVTNGVATNLKVIK
ncbi:MAG: hypothetical protein PHE17_19830 [Thiothrix sp.]|uniref:hypothetical protein n=1 Tax=Thiothrix sp. TaxID=1032 RepID=UPI00260A8552|nr:hypothetical protein [Thiothrix sp.]MDD5395279.1 hypothetical protein [Thiothrix sp.]